MEHAARSDNFPALPRNVVGYPVLYFAYGSNLNASDLAQWCQEKEVECGFLTALYPAWLPDHQLGFTHRSVRRQGGTLDIRPGRGHIVPGVVFQVAPGGWASLDLKEGVHIGVHYRPLSTAALLEDGTEQSVTTYTSARPEASMAPAKGYREVVEAGYEAYDLPQTYLDQAAQGNPPAALNQLFVYGTLMPGHCRWPVLETHSIQPPRQTTIQGTLHDRGAYPAFHPGAGKVHGFVCTVDDVGTALSQLDEVEGHLAFGHARNLFRRCLVRTSEGTLAWTYALDHSAPGPRIPSGRWADLAPAREPAQ